MKQTSKMITIGLLITVIILCLSFSMAITAAAGPAASTQAGPMGQPSGEEAGEQPFELFGDEDEFILLGSDDLIPAESESFEGESTEFFNAITDGEASESRVVLSGLEVSPSSSGKVEVRYTVANYTDVTLTAANTIAFYRRNIVKDDFLFTRKLNSNVAPGESVQKTETISLTGIGSVKLVLRLFDTGSDYPVPRVTPATADLGKYYSLLGKKHDHIAEYNGNEDKTVILSPKLDVDARKSSDTVSVSYTIRNNTAATLSANTKVAFYKVSVDPENLLFVKEIGKSVKTNEETTISQSITSSGTHPATYPLVIRLFDNGSIFPYCYPNPFYDGNKSNKMAKEIDNEESYAEEMKKTVEIKDLDVKDKTKAKITVSYYLYNYTGKELSPKSCVAFYKYSADTDKFLFKKEIGKSIPKISMDEEGNPIPVKIEHTITSSSTYSGNYPLVLRFFDNGAKFPYTYPNAFFDINPDGKTLCESGETDTGKTVSISDISVVKNGISKVTVTYKVTNTTDKALDKSSRVAFYENKPVSANLLKKSTLGKSVPNDGIPVEISQILENTNVSKMRIVARLFDNAETFPYFCPNILLDFNLKNKDAKASAFEKKIICVGDSNTYGYNVTPKKKYPYQLQEKLNVPGYDYAVVNYGVSSRTANSLGNLPYTGTSAYKKAIASEPDIVIINLGPNDTKDVNWITSIRSKFKKNYKALIREFQNLEIAPGIHPKIYIATPVRVLKTSSRGISEVRTEELRKEIIKIAEELQEENEAMDGVFELTLLRPELIFDTFDPATLKKCYQSDNLHLTSFGCEKLSAYYYDILTSD